MPKSINLSLTDELRGFVEANSRDGTRFRQPPASLCWYVLGTQTLLPDYLPHVA